MLVVCKRSNRTGVLEIVFDFEYSTGALIETDLSDYKDIRRKFASLKSMGFDAMVVPVGVSEIRHVDFTVKNPDVRTSKHFWPVLNTVRSNDYNGLSRKLGDLFEEIVSFLRENE